MNEILPWSIGPMKNKTQNIPSFHSISGQLSNSSTKEKQKVVRQLEYRRILRLTYSFPCLNCFMTRLLVVPSSSICQISILQLVNPRAIRFAEIHSTLMMNVSRRSSVWKWFSFVAFPFARVFHKNTLFLSCKMRNQERGQKEVDTNELFTTFFPSPKRDTEQANRTKNSRRFLPIDKQQKRLAWMDSIWFRIPTPYVLSFERGFRLSDKTKR